MFATRRPRTSDITLEDDSHDECSFLFRRPAKKQKKDASFLDSLMTELGDETHLTVPTPETSRLSPTAAFFAGGNAAKKRRPPLGDNNDRRSRHGQEAVVRDNEHAFNLQKLQDEVTKASNMLLDKVEHGLDDAHDELQKVVADQARADQKKLAQIADISASLHRSPSEAIFESDSPDKDNGGRILNMGQRAELARKQVQSLERKIEESWKKHEAANAEVETLLQEMTQPSVQSTSHSQDGHDERRMAKWEDEMEAIINVAKGQLTKNDKVCDRKMNEIVSGLLGAFMLADD